MKFPRNAKPFRGQLDAAPYAGVFFCLVLLLLLAMLFTPPPGVRIQLPRAEGLPGTSNRTLAVALDAAGQLYFENQGIEPLELKARLEAALKKSQEPITLVIQADQAVSYEKLMSLALLARSAGIKESLLATLPRSSDVRVPGKPQP